MTNLIVRWFKAGDSLAAKEEHTPFLLYYFATCVIACLAIVGLIALIAHHPIYTLIPIGAVIAYGTYKGIRIGVDEMKREPTK